MKRTAFAVLALLIGFSTSAYAEKMNTWYAGTKYNGVVNVQGLNWTCSGGTCILRGPYGDGLNMAVCQELSKKVGGLNYYYNDSGMVWSETDNRALLAQCNKR